MLLLRERGQVPGSGVVFARRAAVQVFGQRQRAGGKGRSGPNIDRVFGPSPTPYFYAVAVGQVPGVYRSWDECKAYVLHYKGARHKKFRTLSEAQNFIVKEGNAAGAKIQRDPAPSKPQLEAQASRQPHVQQQHQREKQQQQQQQREKVIGPPRGAVTYYAVASGRSPGVYTRWGQVQALVKDSYSACFKGFDSWEEAQAYIDEIRERGRLPGDPDPQDPETLVAFCDGSAFDNGRSSCRSGWACVFPHRPEWTQAEPMPKGWKTNNRAEYTAAMHAMQRANHEDPSQTRPLYIFTDSQLLIRSMTQWVPTWMKAMWLKADGSLVLNRDLLEQLVSEQGSRRVIFQHVKAHTRRKEWEYVWNARADKLAKKAANWGQAQEQVLQQAQDAG